MSTTATLADRIRQSRQRKGWSGADLGRNLQPEAPVPRQTISHWETGLHVPGLELFAALCQVLEESADWLLFGVVHGPAVKIAPPKRNRPADAAGHSQMSRADFNRRIPRVSRSTKTKNVRRA